MTSNTFSMILCLLIGLAVIVYYDWIGYQMQYEVEWSKHGPRLCNIPPHGDCTYFNDIEPAGENND